MVCGLQIREILCVCCKHDSIANRQIHMFVTIAMHFGHSGRSGHSALQSESQAQPPTEPTNRPSLRCAQNAVIEYWLSAVRTCVRILGLPRNSEAMILQLNVDNAAGAEADAADAAAAAVACGCWNTLLWVGRPENWSTCPGLGRRPISVLGPLSCSCFCSYRGPMLAEKQHWKCKAALFPQHFILFTCIAGV